MSKRSLTTTSTTRAKIPKSSTVELPDRRQHAFKNKHWVSPKERHATEALPPIPDGMPICKQLDFDGVGMFSTSSQIYRDTSLDGQHYCRIDDAEGDSLLPQGQSSRSSGARNCCPSYPEHRKTNTDYWQKTSITKMHSSRMRTTRSSICSQGGCLL